MGPAGLPASGGEARINSRGRRASPPHLWRASPHQRRRRPRHRGAPAHARIASVLMASPTPMLPPVPPPIPAAAARPKLQSLTDPAVASDAPHPEQRWPCLLASRTPAAAKAPAAKLAPFDRLPSTSLRAGPQALGPPRAPTPPPRVPGVAARGTPYFRHAAYSSSTIWTSRLAIMKRRFTGWWLDRRVPSASSPNADACVRHDKEVTRQVGLQERR